MTAKAAIGPKGLNKTSSFFNAIINEAECAC